MAKKRYASGGITISMGGGQSSDGVFGEKANSGNPYPFPNSNAGDTPTVVSQYSEGMQSSSDNQPKQPQQQQQSEDQSGAKMFKRGGSVKASASRRGDGIAQRGKTKGRWVK